MIKPRILKGTRDFGPVEMAKRNFVRDTIKGVFELYGYDPIETPVIEYAETILGKYGEEGDKLTYSFKDNGDREVALRYDQTVPFARFFAANQGVLPIPFKRYEINRVWRADKPQKGRYREFYQCDVDIIGTESILAELELAQIIVESLKALGFEDFVVKVNDRRLINSILDSLTIPSEKTTECIRILDKLEKIGVEAVRNEYSELGLDKVQIDELCRLLELTGESLEVLEKLAKYDTSNLIEFFNLTKEAGIDKYVKFDLGLARGLDYYTGLIFETVVNNTGLGSVAGGGRYDNLCGAFSKQKFSGVGIALGFDRLVDALEILNIFKANKLNSEVLILNLGPESRAYSLEVAKKLRINGVKTEIYFSEAKLGDQFKFAERKEVPFVITAGENEQKEQIVKISNMKTQAKESVSIEEAIKIISNDRK
jgi:histidyl-tRNA synthetase